MSELSPPRASRAQLLGVTRVFDPSKEDVVALSRQICGGEGPHVAIECAGVEKSLHTAINAVRPEGTIVNVALFEKSPTINPNVILKKELTYRGALIYSYDDFEEVISAISSGQASIHTLTHRSDSDSRKDSTAGKIDHGQGTARECGRWRIQAVD